METLSHPPPAPPHSARLYRAGFFGVGAWLGKVLPLGVTRALAAAAGLLYAWTHPGRVSLVHRNLRLLDPALPRRRARRVYAEFGRTLADYFYLGTRPTGEAVKIVSHVIGHDQLAEFKRQGRGALVVTAHFGLFELGGLMLTQAGLRATALTFPEPSPALTAWRAAFRARWDVGTLEIGADRFAFVEIAARLRRGEFVATLIDRPTPGGDVPVQWPGGVSRFSTGLLLLAAHAGWAVVPALMSRQADGTYQSHVFPAMEIDDRGSREETLRYHSQRLADLFLPVLRAAPEQWYQFVPLTDDEPDKKSGET